MTISFEGLDGVGKTTISKKFAAEYNYTYIERPLYSLMGIKDYNSETYKVATELENTVYNKTKSSELKAGLTSLGLIYIHKVMENKNLVLDRDLISNFSFNGTENSLPLFEALLKMEIYPDITFLLYASDGIRKKRISKRNPNDKDLTDPDITSQNYEKIFEFINKYNLPVIIIDTEDKSIDEVYEEVRIRYEEVIRTDGNIKSRRKSRFDT